MPQRRILYLSGTRADFGLMQATLQRIQATPGLQVQVAVTGTHLSPQHGHTVDEVRASGLPVLADIPVDVLTRTGASMALAIAQVTAGMTQLLERARPHALLLLGDRGEMLGGAIAALHLGVPVFHIHGGERSGTVDEPVRHAISKLASYHFTATEAARERLLKMGEPPARIFVSGAPGLDGLHALAAASREETLAALGLPAASEFALALFHPVVQQAAEAAQQTAAFPAGAAPGGAAGALAGAQRRCRLARDPRRPGCRPAPARIAPPATPAAPRLLRRDAPLRRDGGAIPPPGSSRRPASARLWSTSARASTCASTGRTCSMQRRRCRPSPPPGRATRARPLAM
jgi:hypothetical protein